MIAVILVFGWMPVPMTTMPTERPAVLVTVTVVPAFAKLPVPATGARARVSWPVPFLTKLIELPAALSAMGALIVSAWAPYW